MVSRGSVRIIRETYAVLVENPKDESGELGGITLWKELLVDPYETLKSCVSRSGEPSFVFLAREIGHTCSVSRPSGQSFRNPLCLNKQSSNVLSNLSLFQGCSRHTDTVARTPERRVRKLAGKSPGKGERKRKCRCERSSRGWLAEFYGSARADQIRFIGNRCFYRRSVAVCFFRISRAVNLE